MSIYTILRDAAKAGGAKSKTALTEGVTALSSEAHSRTAPRAASVSQESLARTGLDMETATQLQNDIVQYRRYTNTERGKPLGIPYLRGRKEQGDWQEIARVMRRHGEDNWWSSDLRTGRPEFDEQLESRLQENGWDSSIVIMSPDEYIDQAVRVLRRMEDNPNLTKEEVLAARQDSYPEIRRKMLENPEFEIPYLSMTPDNPRQEGINRALAARDLGIRDMPVLVVRDSEQKLRNARADQAQEARMVDQQVQQQQAEAVDTREELFSNLAEAQRGDPERATLRVQHTIGGGVVNYVAEHVGDLIHRMSELPTAHNRGYENVSDKVNKTLRMLKSGYGFDREFRENILSNAQFRGVDPSELSSEVNAALDNYAQQYAKLPAYNRPQELARDAAVAIGDRQWSEAIDNLEELQSLLEDKDAYIRAASRISDEPSYGMADQPVQQQQSRDNRNDPLRRTRIDPQTGLPIDVGPKKTGYDPEAASYQEYEFLRGAKKSAARAGRSLDSIFMAGIEKDIKRSIEFGEKLHNLGFTNEELRTLDSYRMEMVLDGYRLSRLSRTGEDLTAIQRAKFADLNEAHSIEGRPTAERIKDLRELQIDLPAIVLEDIASLQEQGVHRLEDIINQIADKENLSRRDIEESIQFLNLSDNIVVGPPKRDEALFVGGKRNKDLLNPDNIVHTWLYDVL